MKSPSQIGIMTAFNTYRRKAMCSNGVAPGYVKVVFARRPDGKGNLVSVEIPDLGKKEGQFIVTSRRGKQFNSMVYKETDPFNKAERYDVLMNAEDASRLSITEGEGIVVYNGFGVFQGRAKFVDIASGNLEVHFPEGNFFYPAEVMRNMLVFQITTLP